MDAVPRHDMPLVMGDWNAKVVERQEGESGTVGTYGLKCDRNDNGDRFVTFCASNNLAITSTMFPHKGCTQVHMDLLRESASKPTRPRGSQIPVQEVSPRHKDVQRSRCGK